MTYNYSYNIGDIIKTNNGEIEILEQTRTLDNKYKAYKYKCLKDNNVDFIIETNLRKGQGCNVCGNNKTLKGINDIATTHPHLVKYFVDIEDVYKYSWGSRQYVWIKCIDCNQKKFMKICNFTRHESVGCLCSDGYSYPEKVLFSVFKQIHLILSHDTTFEWSKNIKHENPKLCGDKRYDFYIIPLNYIIETHGGGHYLENGFITLGGKTLEEEQENDILKKELAINNGIKKENYIIIDCSLSDIEFIKNNVLCSRLAELFDLSRIDWLKCHEVACGSLVKTACDFKKENPKLSTSDIGVLMNNISYITIGRYLKQGSQLGWCKYDAQEELKNSRKKNKKTIPIKCINNNIILDNAGDWEKQSKTILNVHISRSSILNVCNSKIKQIKGYKFEYNIK